jgi:hypothetical protein
MPAEEQAGELYGWLLTGTRLHGSELSKVRERSGMPRRPRVQMEH